VAIFSPLSKADFSFVMGRPVKSAE